jgi:septal ring factor EnvC (AmiA/AmiB activator)
LLISPVGCSNKLSSTLRAQTMTAEPPKKIYKKDESPSTLRKKSKKLEESRDDWKNKNRERQESLKALKKKFEEIKVVRDCLRLDCLKNANDLKDAEEKIEDLEGQLIKERFEKLHLYEQIEELKKKPKK